MKIEKTYNYIVLDAMLFCPTFGKPDSTDDLALQEKMIELKDAYPSSRCILVFDGGEDVEEWRERHSDFAFSCGWISYYIEDAPPSRCIHSLVSLAHSEQSTALVFSSCLDDLRWVSSDIEFVMVDEDGDLCRHWTLDRFVEIFGFVPSCLDLVKALGGWGDYKRLVPENQIQALVHRFRVGLPMEFGKGDLAERVENRLRILDGEDLSVDDLKMIRRALSCKVNVTEIRRDD